MTVLITDSKKNQAADQGQEPCYHSQVSCHTSGGQNICPVVAVRERHIHLTSTQCTKVFGRKWLYSLKP